VSVRMALLTLLADGPRYGYQLRAEFEDRTGGAWPLNVGQVYTTLGRLVRDGCVEVDAAHGGEDTRTYRATPEGRAAVAGWFATAVPRSEVAPREELVIKLALAVAVPGVDVRDVVQGQRTETLAALRVLTRERAAVPAGQTARLLVAESRIFTVEAEARWLDLVESHLTAAGRTSVPAAPPDSTAPAHTDDPTVIRRRRRRQS